jgi:hypothetical protein
MKKGLGINKNNQLVIKTDTDSLSVKGKWSVDVQNRLVYILSEPWTFRRRYNLPDRIVFEGSWKLNNSHDLVFTLNKTKHQSAGQKLYLKGELIDAKSNVFVFSLAAREKRDVYIVGLLQLKGKWQADTHNRLQFLVKRLNSNNPLTLQGTWKVKRNTIVYTYKKISLTNRQVHLQRLYFKGYWEINKNNRLTYILDSKNASGFDFRTYLETPNLIGKRGAIKYRIGIGAKGSAIFKTQTISIYGVWKLHRKSGISFIVDYGQGRVKAINFGAFVRRGRKGKIEFLLTNRKGKKIGIKVTFTQKILENSAEWFLRIIKQDRQPKLEWGLTLPW